MAARAAVVTTIGEGEEAMKQPANVVIPLPDETRSEARSSAYLGARALWMLGVSVMLGVVVVASLATAALAVRASV